MTKDNALIKGIELAGHSVAEAIKRARVARSSSIVTDALVKFIGTDPHDTYAKTIKSEIENRAGIPVNVSLIPFVSARDLIRHIKQTLVKKRPDGEGLVSLFKKILLP